MMAWSWTARPRDRGERQFRTGNGPARRGLLGRPLLDLVPAHVRNQEYNRRLQQCLSRGEPYSGALHLLRGDAGKPG